MVQSIWRHTAKDTARLNKEVHNDGDREKLAGLIQECYGKSREQADKDIKDWEQSMAA
mgnify:CR=1 FL=1